MQIQPASQSVIIATPDLRGSIQVGSTVVAYATDQLAVLGEALVKGIKQVSSSGSCIQLLQLQQASLALG